MATRGLSLGRHFVQGWQSLAKQSTSPFHTTTSRRKPVCLKAQLPVEAESGSDSKTSLVIFDKDGTLICFHSMWVPWAMETARRVEMRSKLSIAEKVYELLGFCPHQKQVRPGLLAEGTISMIRGGVRDLLISHGVRAGQAHAIAADGVLDFSAHQTQRKIKELCCIRSLFEIIRSHDVLIAVCTADSRVGTTAMLDSLGVRNLVDVVVCGDDPGAMPKPHPRNALEICRRLRILPENAMMVGDTVADLGMAKSAGLGSSVAVLSGIGSHEELEHHADHVISNVGEILPIIVGRRAVTHSMAEYSSSHMQLPTVVIVNRHVLEHLIADGNSLTENAFNMPAMPRLRTLSVNNNKIRDMSMFLRYLRDRCPRLENLSLLDNPGWPLSLSSRVFPQRYLNYSRETCRILSGLRSLDGVSCRVEEDFFVLPQTVSSSSSADSAQSIPNSLSNSIDDFMISPA